MAPVEVNEVPLQVEIEEVYDPLAYNCYLYVKSLVPSLPRTAELIPNSLYPSVSGITILDYKGVPHYVKNISVENGGIWIKESNFKAGEYSTRFLSWEYLESRQAKYWSPVE